MGGEDGREDGCALLILDWSETDKSDRPGYVTRQISHLVAVSFLF